MLFTGKTSKENICFYDTDGLEISEYGVCMSAENMDKEGWLCLNNGSYEGKEIVSSKLIEEVTKPRVGKSKYFR